GAVLKSNLPGLAEPLPSYEHMNIGDLRHTVTLERFTSTVNDYGEPIQAWAPIGTMAASVEPLNGREYFAAAAAQSEVTTRIRMRYFPGVTVTDRVKHGGTVYDIDAVICPELMNRELVLMCKSQ
ncbi:MAG: phage head closure protein, partial [Herbaspirillum sp.]